MKKSRKKPRPIPVVNKQWVLGIVDIGSLIDLIEVEGEFVFMMAIEDGMIIGGKPILKDLKSESIKEGLKDFFSDPVFGVPRKPKSLLVDIRVPGYELSQDDFDLPVEFGVFSELEEIFDHLTTILKSGAQNSDFDYHEYPEAEVRRFFELAARWVELELWEYFHDTELIEIFSEYHKLDWVGSIIGQKSESYGILFFKGLDAFKYFIRLGQQIATGKRKLKEPFFALNFENVNIVPENWRKAQMAHNWPVVDPDFFPLPEIYKVTAERALASGKTMCIMSDILEAFFLFWKKYGKKIISGKQDIARAEFKVRDADITITFPVQLLP